MSTSRHIQRSYLLDAAAVETLENGFAKFRVQEQRCTETYYDTKSSSLSNAECILMRDSASPKYWKFFCFARNNIMEITTDEQEIKEPLSRLLNFRSPDDITEDLLNPFFAVRIRTAEYQLGDLKVNVNESDYGFAHCTIEATVPADQLYAILTQIEQTARQIGLQNLATYESKKFL